MQAKNSPPLKYRIQVQEDIYFTVAVQEILTDLAASSSCNLVALDNFFGEQELR